MAEFPAIPLWTDAYLGDTTHLTTIEHGAYLLLLMAMWRTPDCRLPNDDRLLARYARLTAGQWKRIKPVLMPFFDVSSDGITQGRLTDEHNLVRQNSRKASNSAKARWLKNKETGDADALRTHCEGNAPTPTPTPTPNIEGKDARAIIEDFDRVRIDVFGEQQARLCPSATDFVEATRWLEAGATREACRSIFVARFTQQKIEGRRPSDTLRHMAGAVADAIAAAKIPLQPGHAPSQPRPGQIDLDKILGPKEAANGH